MMSWDERRQVARVNAARQLNAEAVVMGRDDSQRYLRRDEVLQTIRNAFDCCNERFATDDWTSDRDEILARWIRDEPLESVGVRDEQPVSEAG